jgi:hypothetical protein
MFAKRECRAGAAMATSHMHGRRATATVPRAHRAACRAPRNTVSLAITYVQVTAQWRDAVGMANNLLRPGPP